MFKVITVAVAIAACTTVAGAQGTTTSKSAATPATQSMSSAKHHSKSTKAESQATLQSEAKISEESARATALKEVANGSVKSSKLEREQGKLVYSYNITVPGKSGVEQVHVNATDGSVAGKRHESAKTVAKPKK